MTLSRLLESSLRLGLRGGAAAAQTALAAGGVVTKTMVRPAGEMARLGISASSLAMNAGAATPPVQFALDVALQGFNAAAALLPGVRESKLDTDELRELFVATATASGTAAATEAVNLAQAAASAALGDPGKLRREIETALERMRLLAGAGDSLDVLPGDPVPQTLRDHARTIVEHAPQKLLDALNGHNPEAPERSRAVLRAAIEDADNLAILAFGYPQVLSSLATRIGMLLATDSLTLSEVDAFLAGRRFELRRSPDRTGEDAERKSPGAGDARTDAGASAS